MGTWTKLFDIAHPDQRGSIGQITILPDGRLMMHTGETSDIYVVSPDSTGEYTSYRLIDAPYVMQTGAPAMVMNSGKVAILGGHHWESPGQSTVKVFDPETDRVFFISNRPEVGHSNGRIAFQFLDDGRIVAPGISSVGDSGLFVLNEDFTVTFTRLTSAPPQASKGESDCTLLPDGTLFGFRCNNFWRFTTKQTIDLFYGQLTPRSANITTTVRPEYSQVFKDAGSYAGTPLYNDAAIGSISADLGVEDRSWMYIKGGLTVDFTWGGYPLYVTPEIAGNIYMPKIDGVVLVGGTGGEIITQRMGTISPRIVAVTPNVAWTPQDDRNASYPLAVSTVHSGQTAQQIVASGSLRTIYTGPTGVNILGSFPARTPLCIKTTDGWCMILVSAVDVVANQTLTTGQTVTFSDLELNYGRHNSPVSTSLQDQIFLNVANNRAIESWICVLPSGNLAYPSGYVGYYYTLACSMYIWDGISKTSQKESSPFPFKSATGMDTHGCIAPNGKLIMSDGSSVWQYTEDAAPNPSYAPIVDVVPTALETGSTYTLFGRQLSGRHIGFMHGDDWGGHSNIGLVKLVNSQNQVFWAKTKNWSYRGIGANRASTMDFTIPSTVPPGDYKLYAVSCGQQSNSVLVNVTSKQTTYGGDAILMSRYKK